MSRTAAALLAAGLVAVMPRQVDEPCIDFTSGGTRRCTRRARFAVLVGSHPGMCGQHARAFLRQTGHKV